MGDYRVPVGEVELPGVFEAEMLTPFPLWVLVFQVDSESFNVLNPCGDTASKSPHLRLGGTLFLGETRQTQALLRHRDLCFSCSL